MTAAHALVWLQTTAARDNPVLVGGSLQWRQDLIIDASTPGEPVHLPFAGCNVIVATRSGDYICTHIL